MKKLFLLCLASILFACEDDSLIANTQGIQQESVSIVVSDMSSELSITNLEAILQSQQSRLNRSANQEAKNSIMPIVEDGDTLMYVVNHLLNNGYTIFSAKKEYFPILAESINISLKVKEY